MRTIGLIGGMSWESSAVYYRILNEEARARLGGGRSCPLVLHSFDFGEIEQLQHAGRWDDLAERMAGAARGLARAGARGLGILTNTMHRFAAEVEQASGLPVIHIADATGAAILAAGLTRVGLLGTRFTMEQDFYKGRLAERFGLTVLIPEEPGRGEVHRVIYEELVQGRVRESSRRAYQAVMRDLAGAGAQGVILGCTEISLLVGQGDCPVPVFDTTRLHALALLDFCLEGAGE